MASKQGGGFTATATKFFADLQQDNSREFWTTHKAVFDHAVNEPMGALVESLPEWYQPFKIFRMNRDIRFAADKSPYKTQHGAAHQTDGAACYVHLDAQGPDGGVRGLPDGAGSAGPISAGRRRE